MTTIDKIKSSINEQIDHAQIKADALKLQASLEKDELENNIKVKAKEAQDAATKLIDYLESIGASATASINQSVEDGKEAINQGTDTLKVQFALGKMDGKDTVQKVKDDISKYSNQFEMELSKAKEIEGKVADKVKAGLTDYMTKMSKLKATIEAKVESFKH